MIIKQEVLKKIRHNFGLNIYEAKVWLALLSKSISSAGEIAEISGVPRSRTYDVLESLEKQGFAIEKLGKPVKYIAVKPSTVIEKLRNSIVNDAEERAEILAKLKGTADYNELELLHKQGIQPIKASEVSGAIKGKDNIYAHLAEMLENASDEVIIATTEKALQDESKMLKKLQSKLQKNGVDVKMVLNADEEKIKQLSKELSLPIKNHDLNARFCIVDGKSLLFMLADKAEEKEEDMGVWINSEFFASALKQLFNAAWQKS